MTKLMFVATLISTLFVFTVAAYALPFSYDPADIKMGKIWGDTTRVKYTFTGVPGDLEEAKISIYLKSASSAKILYFIDGDRKLDLVQVSGDKIFAFNVLPYSGDGVVGFEVNLKTGSLYFDEAVLEGSTEAHAPIPMSILLLGSSLIGLLGFRRLQRRT